MQLLSKSNIIARKNDEDRVAMKQGLELANRVDGLRKQSLEEESKLTLNRQLMLTEIRDELNSLRLDCESKKVEIRGLAEQKQKLLEPLTVEWEHLRLEQDIWHKKLSVFEMEKESLRLKEVKVSEQLDLVNENLQQAIEVKKEADLIKVRALNQKNEINRLSDNLHRDIQVFTNYRNDETSKLTEKENRLNRKEEELKNKESNLNIQERELYLKNVRIRPKQ